jgi:hypothetical protein
MFKAQDRITQGEILRHLVEILRQLAEVRATVDTLAATQAHILARLPRPDDESRQRVEEIQEDIMAIRRDNLQELLDRFDALLRRMKKESAAGR